MQALVIFHGRGAGFWSRFAGRAGFRHCFVALNDGRAWIVLDPRGDGLWVSAEVAAAVDLAAHYRALGYALAGATVAERRRCYRLPWAFTCVETVKRVLGLHGWWVWTPYQLYRRLEKDDMGSLFNPPSPKSPPPPPPPPKPDDTEVEAARRRERQAAQRRRGRQATILTSGLGDLRDPRLQQPNLLG